MNRKFQAKRTERSVQQGAALVVGMLVTAVQSMVVINAANGTVAQQRMANNYRFAIEALSSAEYGYVSAVTAINDQGLVTNGFDDELDPNGDGLTDDRFALSVADASTQTYYSVVMVDDDDGDGNPAVDANGIVRLVSQGISDAGATRTVDVRIAAAPGGIGGGTPIETAILAQETIETSGDTYLYGTNQDVHSNGDVMQADKINTTGVVSAAGTVYGEPQGGGTATSGADVAAIPNVDPSQYEQYADYIFDSDGYVYDPAGNQVGDGWNTWGGWKFGGDKWTSELDDGMLEGMLYFKGDYANVIVGTAPGTDTDPWEITILADGWIEIAGNPTLENYKDPNDPAEIQQLMFVAGTDIKINGNPGQRYNGIIAAREQFEISGNPEIEGTIIAQGAASTSDYVIANKMSGVTYLAYDGSYSFPGTGGGSNTAVVLSWRDLDVARNGGVFASGGGQ